MVHMWSILTSIFVFQWLLVFAYCGAPAAIGENSEFFWPVTLRFGLPFSYIAIQNIYIDHDVMHGATLPQYGWRRYASHRWRGQAAHMKSKTAPLNGRDNMYGG